MIATILYLVGMLILVADTANWGASTAGLVIIIFASLDGSEAQS